MELSKEYLKEVIRVIRHRLAHLKEEFISLESDVISVEDILRKEEDRKAGIT